MKKNQKGFTLIELIVVIGITSILGGIAVPTYTGYVEKANKAADTETVADIDYAMLLAGRSGNIKTANSGIVGYVLLSEDADAVVKDTLTDDSGTSPNTEYLDSALETAFGDDYESTLRVKYSGWTDVQTMLANADGSVVDSTYITAVGTETMLSDVQGCTTALASFLSWLADDDTTEAYALLAKFLDVDENNKYLSDIFDSAQLDSGNASDVNATNLANATVLAVAAYTSDYKDDVIELFTGTTTTINDNPAGYPTDVILQHTLNVDNSSVIYDTAIWYAAGEALVAYLNDSYCNTIFKSIDMSGGDDTQSAGQRAAAIVKSMNDAYTDISTYIGTQAQDGNTELLEKVVEYYVKDGKAGSSTNTTQSYKDALAFVSMMSTISEMSEDYSTADALGTAGLFTSDDVLNRVNSYVAASGLDVTDTDLAAVLKDEDGSYILVVVQSDGNGNISCTTVPAAAAP